MPLVIQPHGKPESLGGRREAPDALGLMPHLAAEGQREPDDECVDMLVAHDAFELREILDDASSHERTEGSGEAMRVIADGEADAAIADVEREVPHALRRARGRRQRLDLDRDPRVEDRKARPPLRPHGAAAEGEAELRRELAGTGAFAPGARTRHLPLAVPGDLLPPRLDTPLHAVLLVPRGDHP